MKRKFFTLFASVVLPLTLAGLVFVPSFAESAPKPIKFGILLDFTGILAELGDRVWKGLELRLDEVDWKVVGRPIEVIKEDAASNPTITMSKAKKLIDYDKVDVLFGPLYGASNIALAKYCQTRKLFYIGQGTQDIGLGSFSSTIINWGTSQGQFTPLGMYLAEKKGWRTLSLATIDYSGGHKYVADVKKGFESKGGKVIQKLVLPPGTMDYGPYLLKIKKADSCMVWFHTGGTYAIFRKQYKEFGLLEKMPNGPIMASVVGTHMLNEMGDLSIGMIGQNAWVPSIDTPKNKEFVERFRAKYGRDPEPFGAIGHEMATIALAGIEATGGDTDPQKLHRTILGLKLEVVGGPLRFTPAGFGIRNAYMCEAKKVGGKYMWIVDYVHPDLTYTQEMYEKGQALK